MMMSETSWYIVGAILVLALCSLLTRAGYMVFGDYLNDLQLMKAGKYSYAMKNAQREIIEAANFVTEFDNNEDGVVKTIKEFLPEFFESIVIG